MIEWGSLFGISTFVGGFLGLLIGHILNEQYVPEDHGAGTPQHPDNGQFTRDENAYWRWLFVEISSFTAGAILGNLLGTPIQNRWASMTEIQQFGIGIILTVLLLATLERVYRSDVYDG